MMMPELPPVLPKVIKTDLFWCKISTLHGDDRSVHNKLYKVELVVDEETIPHDIPRGTVHLRLYNYRGRSCPENLKLTVELTSDSFCGIDIDSRNRGCGNKLVILYKTGDGNHLNTKLLKFTKPSSICRFMFSSSVRNTSDMNDWKCQVERYLFEKDQSYKVEVSESHSDLPKGHLLLYILPTRLVLCSLCQGKTTKRYLLDKPFDSFDISYSQGERVYVLRLEGETQKKFIRTQTAIDSENISAKISQFTNRNIPELQPGNHIPERLIDMPKTDTVVIDGPAVPVRTPTVPGSIPGRTEPEIEPPVPPTDSKPSSPSDQGPPNPSPTYKKKELIVAVFAGRPCLGGNWIVDVYIVNRNKNPLELRQQLQQCKTSKDHIALPPRRIFITDSLRIQIPELPSGWTFLFNSQLKELRGRDIEPIINGSGNNFIVDEAHQFVIHHDGSQGQTKFLCQVQVIGDGTVSYNIATDFSNYSDGRLGCYGNSILKPLFSTGNDSYKHEWLTFELLNELSMLLSPYSPTGNDWRLLIDYAGFNFHLELIESIEDTHSRVGIHPGELVLRYWYRMKPAEFTIQKLRDTFERMERNDLVLKLDENTAKVNQKKQHNVSNDTSTISGGHGGSDAEVLNIANEPDGGEQQNPPVTSRQRSHDPEVVEHVECQVVQVVVHDE
ncbi:uncharacterized protein LOC144435444 [Glandiceps talaboti]